MEVQITITIGSSILSVSHFHIQKIKPSQIGDKSKSVTGSTGIDYIHSFNPLLDVK